MAVRRRSIDALALVSDGFEIETEIVVRSVRCGLAISEVPSFEAPRRAGASNLNVARDGLRIVRTLLMVRLNLHRVHARADRKREQDGLTGQPPFTAST
jgi:hypothetical protein